VAAPAAAHASTTAAATTGSARPAVVFSCNSSNVEVHFSDGGYYCLSGSPAPWENLGWCGVDWIDTGNNWAAVWWGLGLPTNEYQPGMPPWSVWAAGLPVCVNQIAINT